MYKIKFYKNKEGVSELLDSINRIRKKKDKDSRINYEKIVLIIKCLSKYGLDLGMPYIRRINSDIWEMRPMRNRILFFAYRNNEFVLLHMFYKETNKTPKKEIEKAEKEMRNYIGGQNNG